MQRVITDEVYRFLFENSFDAIFLTHPNGQIFRANPAACEMFQRTEDEICQLGRHSGVDTSDPRLEKALVERRKNRRIKSELNFVRKDGTVFPTEYTSAIFKDEKGETWSVIIVRDISSAKTAEQLLQKAHEEAKHLAAYDYLTAVLNRRAFMERLEQELSRSKREGTSLSIILLDIDHFKRINDTHGHMCGDELLKRAARCLADKLRPYDILGRFGGDEFIACLPNTSGENALIVAERLRKHMQSTDLSCTEGEVFAAISLGVACHEGGSLEDSNNLLQRADKNLYMAKFERNAVYGG